MKAGVMRTVDKSDVVREPYPHVAIAGFTGLGDALDENFPPLDIFGNTVRMDGDLFSEDKALVAYLAENRLYRSLVDELKSRRFIANMIAAFDAEIERELDRGELLLDPRELSIAEEPLETRSGGPMGSGKEPRMFSRIDIGYGGKGYGLKNGGRGIHTDNRRRLFSCLLYLNTPQDMVGGAHRMYSVDADFTPTLSASFSPEADYFVGSLQSNFAFHDVDPITQITGVRKAIYVGITCTTDIWARIADKRQARLTKNRQYPGFLLDTASKAKEFVQAMRA